MAELPNDTRIRKAINTLELALHPDTDDTEVLAAVYAFRRVSMGATLSQIIAGDATEEEWQNLFYQQECEISRLRGEITRLKRGSGVRTSSTIERDSESKPIFVLTDDEWARILLILPEKRRTAKGRERIAVMLGVMRSGCGWRVLDKKWTTYYNQYRSWRETGWWARMMAALDSVPKDGDEC